MIPQMRRSGKPSGWAARGGRSPHQGGAPGLGRPARRAATARRWALAPPGRRLLSRWPAANAGLADAGRAGRCGRGGTAGGAQRRARQERRAPRRSPGAAGRPADRRASVGWGSIRPTLSSQERCGGSCDGVLQATWCERCRPGDDRRSRRDNVQDITKRQSRPIQVLSISYPGLSTGYRSPGLSRAIQACLQAIQGLSTSYPGSVHELSRSVQIYPRTLQCLSPSYPDLSASSPGLSTSSPDLSTSYRYPDLSANSPGLSPSCPELSASYRCPDLSANYLDLSPSSPGLSPSSPASLAAPVPGRG